MANSAARNALILGMTPSDFARFWAFVDRSAEGGCWSWKGSKIVGYGRFSIKNRIVRSHRVTFIHAKGLLPDSLMVDHVCRNRSCCNPEHLRAVTPRVNTLENSMSIPATQQPKSHCLRGHPYDEANTWISKDGKRFCKACKAARGKLRVHPKRHRPGRKQYRTTTKTKPPRSA